MGRRPLLNLSYVQATLSTPDFVFHLNRYLDLHSVLLYSRVDTSRKNQPSYTLNTQQRLKKKLLFKGSYGSHLRYCSGGCIKPTRDRGPSVRVTSQIAGRTWECIRLWSFCTSRALLAWGSSRGSRCRGSLRGRNRRIFGAVVDFFITRQARIDTHQS